MNQQKTAENKPPRSVAPPVDIYESQEDFLLLADLPGVQKADLTVRLDQGELSFEGLRKRQAQGELLAGRDEDILFRRAFTLPGGIDADKIEANLNSGVLRLRIPKAAAFKPRQIAVTSS
ncbi:MAG: Hsp20/alpha crystallin family protein [Myxococcales bacterium]|nr:Hsp20/alpha crystallin family protein [Polyangiaceae bacterium]MDW8248564.1 Hsp20/alpha crystallin family protein [Myxococcales bacterium]